MEERVKKQTFVQLQFCTLLVVCTMLPELKSLLGVPGFDFSVFVAQLVGIIGGGYSLYSLYKGIGQNIPIPYFAVAGSGFLLSLIYLFPQVPTWVGLISLIVLLVTFFMAKKALNIEWNSTGSAGAYMILLAILLHVYDEIGDNTLTMVAAIIGLVLYFMGLGKIMNCVDANGQKGISKLKVAIILSIVAVIFSWLPIVPGIILIIAFLFEFLGYGAMMQSESLGTQGQLGAGKLRISMILMLVAAIIDFIPVINVVSGILYLIALYFVFKGWIMILYGIEDKAEEDICSGTC